MQAIVGDMDMTDEPITTSAALDADLLIGNPDAMVWAERFVERVSQKPAIATDAGTMVAWFASAIMTGYDKARPHIPLADPDPWRMDEWHALPDVCLIAGCESDDIDERGPVWLRHGSMHKACVEHWEGVMRVLGQQQAWQNDAMRSGPTDA